MKIINKLHDKFMEVKEIRRIERVCNLLENSSFDSVSNPAMPREVKTMAIVMPFIGVTSGGGSSILRIGTSIANRGIELTYLVQGNKSQKDIEELKQNASISIPNYQGTFKRFEDHEEYYDICMATNWQSVYYCKQLKGYKAYFIQDFEPFFFDVGDEYMLAKKTYTFGFHHISLGPWNLKQIEKNVQGVHSKSDYITFPYEPSEYSMVERDYLSYQSKKSFNMAVYIKESGRRIPAIIQYLLKETEKKLLDHGIKLNVYYYGLKKDVHVLSGTNLGLLTKKQLFELYKKVDFGMVASMTNISLVPYEMLATGLPTFEFKDGSYSDFLGEDSAMLIGFDPDELTKRILEVINDPQQLIDMNTNAMKRLESLSWDKTCDEFYNIITSGSKLNG